MLLFLKFILKKIDTLNVEFQSEEFRLHQVHRSIFDEYLIILSLYIKETVLASMQLSEINPGNPRHNKRTEDIIVGGSCEALLLQEPLKENEEQFRLDVLAFLIELCKQIKQRFDFSDFSTIAMLKSVDSKVATSTTRGDVTLIIPLACSLPSLISLEEMDQLSNEWNALPHARNVLQDMLELSPPKFWQKLKSVKNGLGQPRFKMLPKLMCNLLVLPHSTACVERVFSQVNIGKTKKTNCLHASTVANRLLAKQAVSRNSNACFSWKPSKIILKDATSKLPRKRYFEYLTQKGIADEDGSYDIFTE